MVDERWCITITFDCNWDCSYCITDTHAQKKIKFDEIKAKIAEVPNGVGVSLSGGEPSLADKEIIEYCFDELLKKDCLININTNGTFFDKYPELVSKCDNIYYHCTENLDPKKGIKLYDNIDYEKTQFMMVITDDNFHNLEWFLDEYPKISFKVTSASQNIVKGRMGSKLSKMNGIKTYYKFKDRIDEESYLFLLENCRTINTSLTRL